MNLWGFVSEHPGWSFLFLIVVATTIETVAQAVASAIARRK